INGASHGPTAPAAPPAGAPPATEAAAEVISAEAVDEILEFELAPVGAPSAPERASDAAAGDGAAGLISLEFEAGAAGPAAAAAAAAPVNDAPVPAGDAPATPAAQPEPVAAATAAEAQLRLEVLPFATLRTNGQTRRFQVLAELSPPPRNPAALDALVLERLMAWLAAHRKTWGSQPTIFTVGVSLATLEDERFVPKVAAALNTLGIAAETLGFEITEALFAQRRALAERFIAQCEKSGSWIMIDDFSFDSQVLPLLRSKAVRIVRIDPKLSSCALKDRLSQALVVAIIQSGRVLGIHCAARRVDSQAQLQWLTAIGCDFAQGAVLSPPLSLDALAASPDVTALTLPQSTRQKS
ncbi:MAG: EAL domain-containing protein, partial [Gammaproteobacteria bacterium]|nr:EAL domain-containing protein [Gammaproteobacteria bacterium]